MGSSCTKMAQIISDMQQNKIMQTDVGDPNEKEKNIESLLKRSQEEEKAAIVLQRKLVGDICPITLCPTKSPFRIVRNNALVVFDSHALFTHIDCTGKRECPMTQTVFTDFELQRLQRMEKKRFRNLQCVANQYNADLQREQTIEYLLKIGRAHV